MSEGMKKSLSHPIIFPKINSTKAEGVGGLEKRRTERKRRGGKKRGGKDGRKILIAGPRNPVTWCDWAMLFEKNGRRAMVLGISFLFHF